MAQSSELAPKNRIGLQMSPRHARAETGPLGTLPALATLGHLVRHCRVSLSLTASGAD